MEPFPLRPVLVERPWGGRRLEQFGKAIPAGVHIGESWEVADLPNDVAPTVPDPNSRVASGPLAGLTLREVIDRDTISLLGEISPTTAGRFPLLFKLLDARENLSVQVHPPRAYVEAHPAARYKTESWFVVDATDDAVLFLDLVEDADVGDVDSAFDTPAVVDLLQEVPAVPGHFHHLPSGLVHAMGAGALVAEVQTPSDTTFRIYDWATEYGRAPRELHRDAALESITPRPPDAAWLTALDGPGTRTLLSIDEYWIREHQSADARSEGLGNEPGPRVVCVTRGAASTSGLAFTAGTTAIIPASRVQSEQLDLGPHTTVIEIGLGKR